MKLKKIIPLALGATLLFISMSGCTAIRNMAIENSIKNEKGANDEKKVAAFEKKFNQVLEDVDNKEDYKKIPFDSNVDTEEFISNSYKLWDKQISKEEFVSKGTKKYPDYKETYNYLADEFTK